MKSTDIIMISVTGTNGSTRKQSTISRSFDGTGARLGDNGAPIAGEVLRNLPNADTIKAPDFPTAQFAAAQAKGPAGIQEVKDIMAAYQAQVAAVESSTGASAEVQIAKSVLAYLEEFHGFKQVDGDHFVVKLDDLDVTRQTLQDGRSSYLVAGTAVFG